MKGIKGIEEVLEEFLPWYRKFLTNLVRFQIENPESDAFKVCGEKIKKYNRFQTRMGSPGYTIFQGKPKKITTGNLIELVKMEEELQLKIGDIGKKHGREIAPYFRLFTNFRIQDKPIPQYDLFLNGIEFLPMDQGTGILVDIVYNFHKPMLECQYHLGNGVMLAFKGRSKVLLPKTEREGNSEYWEIAVHESGNWALRTDLHERYSEFVVNEGCRDRITKFHIQLDRLTGKKRDYLDQRIPFYEKHLGKGALTGLLEMLDTEPVP